MTCGEGHAFFWKKEGNVLLKKKGVFGRKATAQTLLCCSRLKEKVRRHIADLKRATMGFPEFSYASSSEERFFFMVINVESHAAHCRIANTIMTISRSIS